MILILFFMLFVLVIYTADWRKKRKLEKPTKTDIAALKWMDENYPEWRTPKNERGHARSST